MTYRPRWSIRVTHMPTNTVAETNSNEFRAQHYARAACIGLIKARIEAKENGLFNFRGVGPDEYEERG